MNTLFISYHSDISPSTFYRDSSIKLKTRIEQLGGKIYIEQLSDLGSYSLNCLRKPKFILDCLNKFDKPVIWIDADSLVHSLPTELDNLDADVACVEKGNGCPESALIYFNNNENCKKFLDEWIKGCATDKPELDHPVLKEMWYNKNYTEKRLSLPDSICSVRSDSKVQIVLSNTVGKREQTRLVMNRRQQEGKVI